MIFPSFTTLQGIDPWKGDLEKGGASSNPLQKGSIHTLLDGSRQSGTTGKTNLNTPYQKDTDFQGKEAHWEKGNTRRIGTSLS